MSETVFQTVPQAALTDLKARYGEPQRFYHVWAHVEAMLRWFEAERARFHRPEAALHAILWHDAVYDPLASDNEPQSARLLEAADLPGLSVEDRAMAVRMIEATKRHELAADLSEDEAADTALFLDMDLSILGATEAVFDRYEEQVRAEYGAVPDDLYLAGRRGVMTGFAARPTLYFSAWGRDRFEDPARRNIARSLTKTGWRKAEH